MARFLNSCLTMTVAAAISVFPPYAAAITPIVKVPYCESGPRIYRSVAVDRDAGYKKELNYHEWFVASPGPNRDRSRLEAEQHHKLVREIYRHPEWSPDEVAARWLKQCEAHSGRRTNGGAPWIIVDTLE
jgi:hypothetical protein